MRDWRVWPRFAVGFGRWIRIPECVREREREKMRERERERGKERARARGSGEREGEGREKELLFIKWCIEDNTETWVIAQLSSAVKTG